MPNLTFDIVKCHTESFDNFNDLSIIMRLLKLILYKFFTNLQLRVILDESFLSCENVCVKVLENRKNFSPNIVVNVVRGFKLVHYSLFHRFFNDLRLKVIKFLIISLFRLSLIFPKLR